MNFLQSLTHSFEEDLAAAAAPPPRSRPSNMHNEDDYDYAIELRSEEEYRFARRLHFHHSLPTKRYCCEKYSIY
jgi:hypothetical protein